MAIQIQGNGGVVAEVDPSFRAQRIAARPHDPGALGSYRLSGQTGVMAAGLAASSEVFQFRWLDATRLCVIEKILFEGMGSIAAFAAGVVAFRASVARAWTADGSGGTALTPGAGSNTGKMRTSHATSLLAANGGACRIASTAALGAGTKAIDAADIGSVMGAVPATAGAMVASDGMFNPIPGMEHPIILGNQEGIIIRATVPATGTWTAGFTISWTEMTAF